MDRRFESIAAAAGAEPGTLQAAGEFSRTSGLGRPTLVVHSGDAFPPLSQVLYGWRRWLLRLFGARIGRGVMLRPSVEITYPWKVSIGDWSWVGDNVTLYSLGEIEIGEKS